MNKVRYQRRLGWVLFAFSLLVASTNAISILSSPQVAGANLLFELFFNVAVIILIGLAAWLVASMDSGFSRVSLILIFLVPSGPALVGGATPFFGMWMLVIAVTLVIKIDPFPKYRNILFLACLLYTAPWLYVLAVRETNEIYTLARMFNYLGFLIVAILTLYFLFEEELRELMASSEKKDATLADQAATIARLEPLSVLGERVAYVTHSFKNNLSQIGTALYYLEQGKDPEKAKQKIEQFAKAMNERIDNILMVSRAGADQSVEVFDAARVLSGMNQVYLTEPRFLQQAKVELDIAEATPVEAVRWDFLLLAENILKNALEALTEKSTYGTIRVTLKDRKLTLANNGGAMPLCGSCTHDSCLDCPKYGRPGQTSKQTGSGHGLAQVFATCRKYGWTLKIRTEGDWTLFEIGL